MKQRLERIAMIVFLTVILAAAAAGASAENHALLRAEVGYDGTILNGRWYPLEVTVRATNDDVSGVLAVDIGADISIYDRLELPVSVKAGDTQTFHLTILPLNMQRTFDVTLTDDQGDEIGACSVTAKNVVQQASMITGVLSDDDSLAEAMAVSQANDELGRREIIYPVRLDEESVAQDERELSAFDVLAIDGFDVGSLSEAQQQRLLKWVKSGGVVILGTGKATANSLAWFAELTGVQAARTAQELTGVVPALMAYAKATSEAEGGDTTPVRALDAGDATVLAALEGKNLLTASKCGSGVVLTCAFSLSEEPIRRAADEETLWQRVLLAYDKEWYNDVFKSYNQENFSIYESLTEIQRVDVDNGILPVAVFLAAYVIVAGIGLYVFMKRLDRSKELWFVIPAVSIVCVGIVVLLGGQLGLQTPAASSVHVTLYDQENRAVTEESVSISYAGQDRMVITAEDGSVIERRTNGYFNSFNEPLVNMELRDRIGLGDEPLIELCGQATWFTRNLIVRSDRAPQGAIEARAWMEEDGLYVSIENSTDTDLEDAVLLTDVGYAAIGSIRAGEMAQVQLARMDQVEFNDKNGLLIPEGKMLPFEVNTYAMSDACVNPELSTQADFKTSSLSEDEQYRRDLKERRLNMTTGVDGFSCVLIALTPQIPCTQLMANGRPITRTAQSSMVIKQIAMEISEENGYYYIPQGEIQAYQATVDENERPRMGDELASKYMTDDEGTCFGYTIENVPLDKITQIRAVTARYYNESVYLEVYDHELNEWVPLSGRTHVTIDGELLRHAVDGQGELFLRYSTWMQNDGVPEIIVEGSDGA